MFDTLLIITLFLLASLLVHLLTLRLSINTKHLCIFIHSLQILTDFLRCRPPPPSHLLKKSSTLSTPVYFDLPPPHSPIVYKALNSTYAKSLSRV